MYYFQSRLRTAWCLAELCTYVSDEWSQWQRQELINMRRVETLKTRRTIVPLFVMFLSRKLLEMHGRQFRERSTPHVGRAWRGIHARARAGAGAVGAYYHFSSQEKAQLGYHTESPRAPTEAPRDFELA